MNRPNLLFITPVRPLKTGNGLAMRAGCVVEAFTEDFNVFVLLIPIHGEVAFGEPVEAGFEIQALDLQDEEDPVYARLASISNPQARIGLSSLYPKPFLCRFATGSVLAKAESAFAGSQFDVVHVFRVYMAPYAEPFLNLTAGQRPVYWLDIDELESSTRRRIAEIYEKAGNETAGSMERAEALKYFHLERQFLSRFDRVFASSNSDVTELSELGSGRVALLPNAVRVPERIEDRKPAAVFTFLFVGTMGYYPNEDAAAWFCSEVLPLLRRDAPCQFRVVLAGASPSPRVLSLAANPEVTVTGGVRDLASFYRDADAVIVPLREGGGTRVKILEAFSYSRPVVSTRIGAKGLAVIVGEHILLADSPVEFAEKCRLLMDESNLGRRMAAKSLEWVTLHHSIASVRDILRHHYAGLRKSNP